MPHDLLTHDMLTCWPVDLLTCWPVDLLTCWPVALVTHDLYMLTCTCGHMTRWPGHPLNDGPSTLTHNIYTHNPVDPWPVAHLTPDPYLLTHASHFPAGVGKTLRRLVKYALEKRAKRLQFYLVLPLGGATVCILAVEFESVERPAEEIPENLIKEVSDN